jgi:small subunit ribosomal protein S6
MSRTYELGLVIEPRQTEEDVDGIVARYREMIKTIGGTIDSEDNWGKRKLAYPIRKFTEGRYYFFFVSSEEGLKWTDVERNVMQNEKILRHLLVRTDLDLKRAASKGKKREEGARDRDEEDDADEPRFRHRSGRDMGDAR